MRAALVTSSLSQAGGGVSAVVEDLSRALLAVVPDVRVIGLRDAQWPIKSAEWNGAPASALAVRGPSALGYAPAALARLKDIDAAIVHTHGLWTYPSRAVSLWASRTRRPYIVSPHGMLDTWALSHSRWKKAIAARLYENAHLRGAACLHALCEAEAQSIRSLGFRNPIAVIPNGVAPPSPSPTAALPPWGARVPAGAKVMLFLGRLHPKKNLTALIDAWPKHELNDWHLVIAGWDQVGYSQILANKIDQRCLADRIHLVGPLFGVDKETAFRRADAFVLPSLSEGVPMAVLEAWSYGLPVLKTDACNLHEGFSAMAAERLSLDPRDMANDLSRFLTSQPAELKQMGRYGRALVERQFSWTAAAEKFLAVYEWLVNGAERPASVQVS